MSLTWTPAESATPEWTPASDDDLTFTTRGTLSSDAVTVADGTMPVVESVDPPADDKLTTLLASTDATIAAVGGNAATIAGDLAAEVTARGDADDALAGDLAAETTERAAGDLAGTEALAVFARSVGDTVGDTRPKLALSTLLDEGNHSTGAYTTPHIGDLTGGFWLRFTATVLPYHVAPVDPDLLLYSEIFTLPHDTIGSWDNLEPAFERQWDADASAWRTYIFCEWTEESGTTETHQATTLGAYTTSGVTYPVREVPVGVECEWAIWLDFANGDGDWEYKLLRRVYDGTPDVTVDEAEWELFLHVIGDGPTSIDTGVTSYDWGIGFGPGRVHYGELILRDGGPTGTILAHPTAALALAAGEGNPFTDGQGNVWTPGIEAEVFDPTATSGGVALGETSTTAYRGDRGKTAYDHSQVTSGNPHGTTAADVGAAATSHSHTLANISDAGTLAGLNSVASANITDGTIVAADLAASLLGRIPTTVTVASDVPSPTDGTFTNTTGLAVPVVNGSTYYMVGVLDVTGINAADLRVSLTCPTGEVRLSVQGKAYSATVAAADTAYSGEILASGDIVTNLAVLTGRSTLVPFQGRFTATADGTLQIQHSQRTANATATTVKAGSYLTYHT